MTLRRADELRRAALCVLVLGALCAGAGGVQDHGPGGGRDGVVTAGGLPAAPWLIVGTTQPSDLVGLWQSVLWADGYTGRSAVTCTYDEATARVTRVWQSNHHLDADGIVGPATWGAAAQRIVPAGPWQVYLGERFGLPLRPDRGDGYEVPDSGRFHALRTDAVTLALCR